MVQCDKNREAMAAKPIGEIVQTVLSVAKSARRITLGFSDAIKLLSNTPEEAQFCFLAEPKLGDSATHMHEVLLQAFCYEHGIYIIKVDSGRKLAHVLGTLNADETCVLIRKSGSSCATDHDNSGVNDDVNDNEVHIDEDSNKDDATTVAASSQSEEDILVNFCENSWQNADYCIVKLPESWTIPSNSIPFAVTTTVAAAAAAVAAAVDDDDDENISNRFVNSLYWRSIWNINYHFFSLCEMQSTAIPKTEYIESDRHEPRVYVCAPYSRTSCVISIDKEDVISFSKHKQLAKIATQPQCFFLYIIQITV